MNIKLLFNLSLFIYIFLAIFVGITPIITGNFALTFDQGRDFIWVQNQILFKRPSLIGPWGSLTGVYFGPLWFWILGITYLIFGSSPITLTLVNYVIVYSAAVLAYFLFKKTSKQFSLIFLTLTFASPALRGISNYAFSQHLLPILTLALIYTYTQILKNRKIKYIYLASFLIALIYHAEPPTAIFSLPSLVYILVKTKIYKKLSLKHYLMAIFIFILPFSPLILFDLRNNFIQTKSILAYLSGVNSSLGDILPLYLRVIDRPRKILDLIKYSTALSKIIIIGIIAIFIKLKKVTKHHTINKFFQASNIYLISFLLIFTIYPPELKSFYLDGLIILFIFYLSLIIYKLKNKILKISLLILLIIINLKPYQFQKDIRTNFFRLKQNTSNYNNLKTAVDWIYQKADGESFKLYTYVPSVYDYKYQYTILDYGLNQYAYLPEEFAYLTNQPEYVKDKSKILKIYQDKIKTNSKILFLIYEADFYQDKLDLWLSNFSYEVYPLIEKIKLSDGTSIEKRQII